MADILGLSVEKITNFNLNIPVLKNERPTPLEHDHPLPNPDGYSAHLLTSINYELPDGHPDKYRAVFIPPEEMADIDNMAQAKGTVSYSHIGKNSSFSAAMTPAEARPFFLEGSTRRISAESHDKAVIQATQIGIAATGPLIVH